jgi:hypothetical protein
MTKAELLPALPCWRGSLERCDKVAGRVHDALPLIEGNFDIERLVSGQAGGLAICSCATE